MLGKLIRVIFPGYRSKYELLEEIAKLEGELSGLQCVNRVLNRQIDQKEYRIANVVVETTLSPFEREQLKAQGIDIGGFVRDKLVNEFDKWLYDNICVSKYFETYECCHVYQAVLSVVKKTEEQTK